MGPVTITGPNEALRPLKDRLATISDVRAAAAVLGWDQQTYMPPGGVAGRAEQLATLGRRAHEMLVSEETGALLDAAGESEPGSEDAALLRLARRDYERATKLPGRLVAETSRASSLAQPAWEEARATSDWSLFAPHLEKILGLQQETAEHLGYEDHPYDALLDLHEPRAKTARLREVFEELRTALVPVIREISALPDEDRSRPLYGSYDESKQERFGREVISAFGYDWSRGRQDRAVHPFCINFGGPGDVRITTRFDPGWLSPAVFATFHEAGHAIYEQNVDPSYARTPLAGGASMGVHESQSRIYENQLGRSRAFTGWLYGRMRDIFGDFGIASEEDFFRAANRVGQGFIRTEADEVQYNLHVLLRFDLEQAVMRGDLRVADLEAAWNDRFLQDFGFAVDRPSNGMLQDVHWSVGLFGYFPTYSLGNLYAGCLHEALRAAVPDLDDHLARGDAGQAVRWLRDNLQRHGSLREPRDTIRHATGQEPAEGPLLDYLEEKFRGLYGL